MRNINILCYSGHGKTTVMRQILTARGLPTNAILAHKKPILVASITQDHISY